MKLKIQNTENFIFQNIKYPETPRDIINELSELCGKYGNSPLPKALPNQYGPVVMAARNRNLLALKYFIEVLHEDVNVQNGPLEVSPLHYACATSLDCLRYLISKGADVNITFKSGETPLFAAAYCFSDGIKIDLECFKYLLSHGANLYAKDQNGTTPYDLMSKNEVLSKLLKETEIKT